VSEKDGFGEKWYAQRQARRRRHAERAEVTPGKVAAAINFYAPTGTPVIDVNGLKPQPGLVSANARGPSDNFLRLCLADGLPYPVLEYQFHDTRKWRFDYAWPSCKVAVEREGGLWADDDAGKRAHAMPLAILRDMEKGNAAVLLGWRVLRYTPEQLLAGAVAEIRELLR
jgi:hypothetical protein